MSDTQAERLARVMAILVRHSSRRARREITELLDKLDQEDAMTDGQRPDDTGQHQSEPAQPRYPDESLDEPDRSAPVGDRMYVPQELLDLDGKQVTFRGVDQETGAVVEGTGPVVLAPEHFKEAARRRGEDVDV